MTGALATAYRSAAIGELSTESVGSEVRLAGWVHRTRDLGSLVFFDLRDRSGTLQVSFDPDWASESVLAAARRLSPEDVVTVRGTVQARPEEARREGGRARDQMEIQGADIQILSAAEALPIPVYRSPDEELPAEEQRLRYRYLDLRRPELQANFVLRHGTAESVRRHLSDHDFLELETPLLTKRTPEGARDYLVPSRVHAGEFYALPQSPQLYKQLLMAAGFDRYFQIARCLRDEDLRADRQPEFTQVDLEMSFVGMEDVLALTESMLAAVWRDVMDVELATPFPRMTYREAMARYGTDKPDLRFGLPVLDLTETLRTADFRVFQSIAGTPQRIRGLRVPGGAELSRKELDGLQEVARGAGAPGALWVKRTEEGFSGSFARALTGEVAERFIRETAMRPGDLFVMVVGCFQSGGAPTHEVVLEPALDRLRRGLGARMSLIQPDAAAWAWITDFPLLQWEPEQHRVVSAHHPFTMPHPEDLADLRAWARDPELAPGTGVFPNARSLAYDAVYNGHEIASGSVRIHDGELQREVFRILGIPEREAEEKFGFLLEAFRYGVPPHAGIALGFDRLVMLMSGASSLRDVIAFPKTTAARALLERAPSPVPEADLRGLGLRPTDAS